MKLTNVCLFVIFILYQNNVIIIFSTGSMKMDVHNECNEVLIMMMGDLVDEMERRGESE